MNIGSVSPQWAALDLGGPKALPPQPAASSRDEEAVREAFNQFVGETFFMQMLSSMRKTLGKPAYFHGGRAEEIFQGQLDQTLAEKMTESSGERFAAPMFELFNVSRPR